MDEKDYNSESQKNNKENQNDISSIPDMSIIPPLPDISGDNKESHLNITPPTVFETPDLNAPEDKTRVDSYNVQKNAEPNYNQQNHSPESGQYQQFPPAGSVINNAPQNTAGSEDANKNLNASHVNQANNNQTFNNQRSVNTVFIPQRPIPNSSGVLTLGILSILSLCCCGGFLAPILSIIALAMTPKAKKTYAQNPNLYSESSLRSLNAGKICAIIGLALASLFIIYIIVLMIVQGKDANYLNEAINQAWNETGY